jgi:hypothetical protein
VQPADVAFTAAELGSEERIDQVFGNKGAYHSATDT